MTLKQQLGALFSREIDCLQSLLDILNQEYDALVNADIDAIEQATLAKNGALATQAEVTQSRQTLTIRSSFSDTNEGLRELIDSCENPQELHAAFSRLSTLARQCQAINRSNGRLIVQKQQQARGALNIIRQSDHITPTYSGRGKTTAARNTRSLGKA